MNNEQLAALMENEQFTAEMEKAESAEQFQEVFARYGVDLSLEEIRKEMKQAEEAAENADGELSEDALEDVAGGITFGGCIRFFWPRRFPLPMPGPRPRPRWPRW